MTKIDKVAQMSANNNKSFRVLDWYGLVLNHPSDLILEMADQLIKQKKWREENHYLSGDVRQGDITLRFYVTVSSDDGGNSAWADVMADISVDGQGCVSTEEHCVMFTDEDGILQFDFDARDMFFDEIEDILADERNFVPKNKEVC